ncbi:hypothetical protein Vretimale_15610 [Volvox reticuliferus]|uniref:Rab-GAP TBC domain-containing protein n=1 Tax=Volvox reticuliferus TaxID=1737510 RepID=A0A8J4FUS5_9CHLO|nr:hypothetical protein Vretifemale_15030 [Volvox reticuliferus]GIM12213.1 hypothetical protein Vretimale_15610 [Volvox reticuliferus]
MGWASCQGCTVPALLTHLHYPDFHICSARCEIETLQDLSRLRRLAVTHGFVNDRIRAVVWPRLLGLSIPAAGGLKLGQMPYFPSSQGGSCPQEAFCARSGQVQPSPQPQPRCQEPVSRSSSIREEMAPLPPTAQLPFPQLNPSEGIRAPLSDGTERIDTCSLQPMPQCDNAAGDLGLQAKVATTAPQSALGEQQSPAAAVPQPDGREGEVIARCASREAMPLNSDSVRPLDGCSCITSRCSAGGFTVVGGKEDDGATTHLAKSGSGAARPCANHDANQDADIDMGAWRKRRSEQEGGLQLTGPEDLTFDSGRRGDQDEEPTNRDLDRWDGGHSDHRQGSDPWDWDWQRYLRWSQRPHRDSAVVEVDVARSLWAFTRDLNDQQREARRQQLKRVLNAVVAAHGGDVFYYQGLHDVASVLLMCMPGSPTPQVEMLPPSEPLPLDADPGFSTICNSSLQLTELGDVASSAASTTFPSATSGGAAVRAAAYGELLAFALLRRLVTTHLRDATRPSLEPVVQLLGLMPYLVRAADPTLARHMADRGLQPFFALSWFLTWWAHELDELSPAARLFDFFLASHPLMPLYLGAVAMRSQRTTLLACEDMPELHSTLMNLKLVTANSDNDYERAGRRRSEGNGTTRASMGGMVGVVPLKELIRQAEQLWLVKPPHALVPLRVVRGSQPFQQRLRKRRGYGDSAAAVAAGRISGCRDGGMGDGEVIVTLTACVAHAAKMEGQPALWKVPNTVPAEWSDDDVGQSGLGRIFSRANRVFGTGRSRRTLLSTALLAGVYVAAAVAIGYATLSRTTPGRH